MQPVISTVLFLVLVTSIAVFLGFVLYDELVTSKGPTRSYGFWVVIGFFVVFVIAPVIVFLSNSN